MANSARMEKFGKVPKQSTKPVIEEAQFTAPFVGYINWKPTDDDKNLFASWLTGADLSAILDEAGDDGYKLGLGFDEKTKAYNATLTCRNPKLSNAGYVLSVRAPSASKALQRLLFCHVAVAGVGWERLGSHTDDEW